MTFVAKSGTNQFHGSAYEFLRNNDFDANDFFSNKLGRARQIYKQNDFGATVGGPVWIPKIYNGRNKTFFFFSYEGFRNRNGATNATATVPTAEMYNGDFSNWVTSTGAQIPIYDPTTQVTNANGNVTRTHFAGNKIPGQPLQPASVQALKTFQASGVLAPNTGARPGTAAYVNNNYIIANGSNVQPVNKVSVKGDHLFNEKHRISGYYGYDRESVVPGADGPATLTGQSTPTTTISARTPMSCASVGTGRLSATKFNHFYAGGNNWRQDHNPPQSYIGNWKNKFCLGNVPNCNENLVNLFYSGDRQSPTRHGAAKPITAQRTPSTPITTTSPGSKAPTPSNLVAAGRSITTTDLGASARLAVSASTIPKPACRRVPIPTRAATPLPLSCSATPTRARSTPFALSASSSPTLLASAQDDWHVNKKLTVNLGLRWETNLPPTGLDDRWSDFSPTTPNPAAGGRPRRSHIRRFR